MEPNTNLHPGNRPSSAVSRYLTFSPLPRLSLPVGFYLFRRSENNAGNRVRRYEALLSSTFSAMDFEKNIDKGCIGRDVGTCKKTKKKQKEDARKYGMDYGLNRVNPSHTRIAVVMIKACCGCLLSNILMLSVASIFS